MYFLKRLLTWWNSQTIGTQLFTARKGVKVGEDEAGNIFYQTKDGVRRWVIVAAITGSVGIMIGALELSGVGIKISSFILDLSGKNLILTMILVGIACFLLGMGLDAIPVYVTLATLMAPAAWQQ